MTKVVLISDTHDFLDDAVLRQLDNCDEIWHAGDFGTIDIANSLRALKPLRGVYGNIDGYDVRSEFTEQLLFYCEEVKVLMKHIGGYPGRYAPGIREMIIKEQSQLFISGHSHILKIIYDDKLHCLHMNAGAVGLQGWHKVRTLIRFVINGKEITNCEVVELGIKVVKRKV
jgi:putative phosphoesterase